MLVSALSAHFILSHAGRAGNSVEPDNQPLCQGGVATSVRKARDYAPVSIRWFDGELGRRPSIVGR
jgi:hypothetical protein